MSLAAPARRRSHAAQLVGYLIGAVMNAALLYLVNVRPGWHTLPWLTGDTQQVLGLVNVSLTAGLAANLVYLAYHPEWLRTIGDLVTTGIALAVLVRVLQVFPFDLTGSWVPAVRVLLLLAAVGTAIGVLVLAIAAVRRILSARAPGPP